MKRVALAVLFAAAVPAVAHAQAKEQFVPVNSYWVGPYAPGGSGIAAGMIDYFKLLNARDGGINEIGSPQLLEADPGEFVAHRRNERFGIRHGSIMPQAARIARYES